MSCAQTTRPLESHPTEALTIPQTTPPLFAPLAARSPKCPTTHPVRHEPQTLSFPHQPISASNPFRQHHSQPTSLHPQAVLTKQIPNHCPHPSVHIHFRPPPAPHPDCVDERSSLRFAAQRAAQAVLVTAPNRQLRPARPWVGTAAAAAARLVRRLQRRSATAAGIRRRQQARREGQGGAQSRRARRRAHLRGGPRIRPGHHAANRAGEQKVGAAGAAGLPQSHQPGKLRLGKNVGQQKSYQR